MSGTVNVSVTVMFLTDTLQLQLETHYYYSNIKIAETLHLQLQSQYSYRNITITEYCTGNITFYSYGRITVTEQYDRRQV